MKPPCMSIFVCFGKEGQFEGKCVSSPALLQPLDAQAALDSKSRGFCFVLLFWEGGSI